MDPTSTLQLIAQLAVAMAGFSSVVVAYGRRFEDGWKASDRIRLSLLVGDSDVGGAMKLAAACLIAALALIAGVVTVLARRGPVAETL